MRGQGVRNAKPHASLRRASFCMSASHLRHRIGPLLLYTRQHAQRCLRRWRLRSRTINVIFRYDDYSTYSATELELKIINLFASHHSCLTFGVIPFRCSGDVHDSSPQPALPLIPEKADILRRAHGGGTIEVALHGYSHQTAQADKMTEFEGLDYETQKEKITKGKQFLETTTGASVTTFVPPWNSYDIGTLRVLRDQGFRTLSAGYDGDACEGLGFVPATCDPRLVRDAVHVARNSNKVEPLIVVLFHDYEFTDMNHSLGKFSYQDVLELLEWLKEQRDIRLMSLGSASKAMKDLSSNRYMARQWLAPGVY
jgi:peptidoglycan/xylan/chitin deacetylase (PgdA/CDA1 family)